MGLFVEVEGKTVPKTSVAGVMFLEDNQIGKQYELEEAHLAKGKKLDKSYELEKARKAARAKDPKHIELEAAYLKIKKLEAKLGKKKLAEKNMTKQEHLENAFAAALPKGDKQAALESAQDAGVEALMGDTPEQAKDEDADFMEGEDWMDSSQAKCDHCSKVFKKAGLASHMKACKKRK